MKKHIYVIIYVLCFLLLCFCVKQPKETTPQTEPSRIYSQEDIAAAIAIIKEEFASEWDGCTLTEIYYAGDKISLAHQDWAIRHGADEAIVLLSTFDVAPTGADGSLNPDSTYHNWNWILVRTKSGEWIHVDHGY